MRLRVKLPKVKLPAVSLKVKAPKVKASGFIRPAMLWQALLVLMLLGSFGLAGKLWMSGTKETREAVEDGRRLVIRLDNGEVSGKIITRGDAPADEADKPEEKTEKTEEKSDTNGPTGMSASLADTPPIVPAAEPMPDMNPALAEKTKLGILPVIGADGMKPWQYYSKPANAKSGKPIVAVIVTGLGESKNITDSAIKLPENFTLSFSAYGRSSSTWVTAARVSGHEVLVDLPLEPSNYPVSDPGPYGLLVGKGKDENEARLRWLMSRFQCYVGFIASNNEAFSDNNEAFKDLLQSLGNRGLLLVMPHEPAKDENKQLLETTSSPNVVADIWLDEELSVMAIQARLSALQQLAEKRGYAVGIAQAYPISIQQLNAWSAKLAEKGITLVPISAIAKKRFS